MMPITFDSALGIHDRALAIRSKRAEMLASNIANADTPGYKAKDIDFKSAMARVSESQSSSLKTTHPGHISTSSMSSPLTSAEVMYRTPNQSSLDGNTVDTQLEKSAFADNALRYQASLSFLDGKFRGLIAALKGE